MKKICKVILAPFMPFLFLFLLMYAFASSPFVYPFVCLAWKGGEMDTWHFVLISFGASTWLILVFIGLFKIGYEMIDGIIN